MTPPMRLLSQFWPWASIVRSHQSRQSTNNTLPLQYSYLSNLGRKAHKATRNSAPRPRKNSRQAHKLPAIEPVDLKRHHYQISAFKQSVSPRLGWTPATSRSRTRDRGRGKSKGNVNDPTLAKRRRTWGTRNRPRTGSSRCNTKGGGKGYTCSILAVKWRRNGGS
jgi:hypothetical protein